MLIIVFQEGVLEFAPYDWQTLPVGIRQWSNLYMPLPLSICTGFFQFSSLKYRIWWSVFFFSSLKYQVPKSQFRNPFHWIYRVVENIISKRAKMKFSQVSISLIHRNLKKNPVHQTRYFKLKNWKNSGNAYSKLVLVVPMHYILSTAVSFFHQSSSSRTAPSNTVILTNVFLKQLNNLPGGFHHSWML